MMDIGSKVVSPLTLGAPPIAPKVRRTETDTTNPSQPHASSQRVNSSPQATENQDGRDNVMTLDILYVSLESRLRLVLRWVRKQLLPADTDLERKIVRSLENSLVDLQVWAYDISNHTFAFLECLQKLTGDTYDSLSRIFEDIGSALAVVENRAYLQEQDDTNDKREYLQGFCREVERCMRRLKSIKSSVRDTMPISQDPSKMVPTEKASKVRAPTILCLDGGGVRTYSSLLILRALARFINEDYATATAQDRMTDIKPSLAFNHMFGSSSGGLVAIMLGRLEMAIDDAIQSFLDHINLTFSQSRRRRKLVRPFLQSKYDARKISEAAKSLIGENDPIPLHEKWRRYEFRAPECLCKTGVFATTFSAGIPEVCIFRTYDCNSDIQRDDPRPLASRPGLASKALVWEVARATSAAPLFFPPQNVDGIGFVDGGLMANNPTLQALREIAYLHGDLSDICVVSIGSGHLRRESDQASQMKATRWPFRSLINAVSMVRSAASETEDTSEHVSFEISMHTGSQYYRFNAPYEREIPFDEWDDSGKTRRDIEFSTQNYLEHEEIRARLRQCASVIVANWIGKARARTENTHFLVPRRVSPLFTGRQQLIRHIEQLLSSRGVAQSGQPKIFVITGPGGQGKSEICLKLASDLREKYWGVFYVDAGSYSRAENDFKTIAERLGSQAKDLKTTTQVLSNTKEKWLLILDNADDPSLDYSEFLPFTEQGTIIVSSRNSNSNRYSTIGTAIVDGLSVTDSVELLLKTSGVQQSTASYEEAARNIIGVLGNHTLALSQAGAYIAEGYCSMEEYPEVLEGHRLRLLQHKPQPSPSWFGSIYATFQISIAAIDSAGDAGQDALKLLDVLSMFHPDSIPLSMFKNASHGALHLRRDEMISWLPDFLMTDQSASIFPDFYRFFRAVNLLQSHMLVTKTDSTLSMHRIVRELARARHTGGRQMEVWLMAGSLIVLSNYRSSSWQQDWPQLRPHVKTFIYEGWPEQFPSGIEDLRLEILRQCGQVLLQMREDLSLSHLLTRVLASTSSDSNMLPFYELQTLNLMHLGKSQLALEVGEKALSEVRQKLGEDDSTTLIAMGNMVTVLCESGHIDEAAKLGVVVVQKYKRTFGSNHPRTLTSMTSLAEVYNCQERHSRAEQLLTEVVECSQTVLGHDHPETFRYMAALGTTYLRQGRLQEAEQLLTHSLEGSRRLLGGDHPNALRIMTLLREIERTDNAVPEQDTQVST